MAHVSRPTLLLVHGAWHNSWCWDKVRPLLEGDGWATRTVDLPSAGEPTAGIHDDTRVVLEELQRIDGPVVVVAHSYGGIPVTQAIADAVGVVHAVYVAAYRLDTGESLLGHHGAPVPEKPQGVQPVPADPVPMFYGDMPEPEAKEAARRLVPQSTKSFSETLTRAGWHTVPTTYVVCEQDQALPPQNQEAMAARAGAVHRLATHHSPFLSAPAEFAALLAAIAGGPAD